MCKRLLLALSALTLTACASGTEALRPAPLRCQPSDLEPGPATLSTLSTGTRAEVISAHDQDAASYFALRTRHEALADCVRAYSPAP